MIRLAEAIMIASDAALARHFVPKGLRPFHPRRFALLKAVQGRHRTYAGGCKLPRLVHSQPQPIMIGWARRIMIRRGNPRMRGFHTRITQ